MTTQLRLRPRQSEQRHLSYLRHKLLDKRSQLQRHLTTWLRGSNSLSDEMTGDVVDMASQGLAQDTACRTVTARSRALSDVDQALQKLDTGTYGICDGCGARIPYTRLREVPYAPLCVECQQQEEQEWMEAGEGGQEWEEDMEGLDHGYRQDAEEGMQTIRGRVRF